MRANKEIRPKKAKKKEEVQAWGFEGGKIPNYKDYRNPKQLTKLDKELVKATREAMEALREEIAKYGEKDFSDF